MNFIIEFSWNKILIFIKQILNFFDVFLICMNSTSKIFQIMVIIIDINHVYDVIKDKCKYPSFRRYSANYNVRVFNKIKQYERMVFPQINRSR